MKAMDRFAFLQEKFSQISMEKLKAGIFECPQIRELMKDPMFDKVLSKAKLSTLQSLKSVVTNVLGNYRSVEYEKETEELLKSFHQHGAQISGKLHFLWSQLDHFPKNCGDLSEEQGECFHQDVHIIEECYQGQWDVNFLADYNWCLKRDSMAAKLSSMNSFCIFFSLLWCNLVLFGYLLKSIEEKAKLGKWCKEDCSWTEFIFWKWVIKKYIILNWR